VGPPSSPIRAPKISVVIIFYDSETFLAEAIDSALAQDFENFEVLLVDDGSRDASTAIAQSYARRLPEKVRYLEHPRHANRGMSATRNLGVSAARGDFIALLDSDDRWSPQKLREQIRVFERHPGVDVVCGTVRYWRSWADGEDTLKPSGHVHDRPVPPPGALLSIYPFGSACAPSPSDLLIRREAYDAVGGFEESFTGAFEDQAFLSKIYLERTVYFATKVWLDYRLHEKSCMAETRRAGMQHLAKLRFMTWFDHYLTRSSRRRDWRTRLAVKKAILRVRRARILEMLHAPMNFSKSLLGRGAPSRA
jgi:glycosyltransferase involved in cell wall biosynthesis